MNDFDVTVSRTIQAPAARVWSVLTEPELVSLWMLGTRVQSTWSKGAAITWTGMYDGKEYSDRGEVVDVRPAKRLVHTHFRPAPGSDAEPENVHTLDWGLAEKGGTTTLTLVQTGARSQEESELFAETWAQMLDALKQAAEGPSKGLRTKP